MEHLTSMTKEELYKYMIDNCPYVVFDEDYCEKFLDECKQIVEHNPIEMVADLFIDYLVSNNYEEEIIL